MNEIVDALLAGYQFRSLPNRRILSSGECQFFQMMLSRPRTDGLAVPPQATAGVALESLSKAMRTASLP
jgi:hypothetical protein